ncbi:hypothetical protein DPMN_106139 [Dreissena polymorpha]|uniref:Uncharacterized protein n=1 Tax=Dreissena polymorpha TaxID=45954 RepID=A0A9D4QI56_DREPO|nr:hypothetical protein DPMN_106139 [Dreissena polymorpha]
MEAATKDIKELQGNKFPTQSVNKLSLRQNYDSKKHETGPKPKSKGQQSKPLKTKGKFKPCYRCNRTNYLANCRFKNSKCPKCGKTGNIVPACKQNFHNLDVAEEEYEEYMFNIRDDNDMKFIKVNLEVNGKRYIIDKPSAILKISRYRYALLQAKFTPVKIFYKMVNFMMDVSTDQIEKKINSYIVCQRF